MAVVPMCKMCGEYEIATFQVHNDFCSDRCADMVYGAVEYDTDGEPVDTQGWYDDEPSPYAGTYSED
jgi:hypothetical protein